jgi:hypothetical protein
MIAGPLRLFRQLHIRQHSMGQHHVGGKAEKTALRASRFPIREEVRSLNPFIVRRFGLRGNALGLADPSIAKAVVRARTAPLTQGTKKTALQRIQPRIRAGLRGVSFPPPNLVSDAALRFGLAAGIAPKRARLIVEDATWPCQAARGSAVRLCAHP